MVIDTFHGRDATLRDWVLEQKHRAHEHFENVVANVVVLRILDDVITLLRTQYVASIPISFRDAAPWMHPPST